MLEGRPIPEVHSIVSVSSDEVDAPPVWREPHPRRYVLAPPPPGYVRPPSTSQAPPPPAAEVAPPAAPLMTDSEFEAWLEGPAPAVAADPLPSEEGSVSLCDMYISNMC